MILDHSFSIRKELGERLDVESKSVIIYLNDYLGVGPRAERLQIQSDLNRFCRCSYIKIEPGC